MSPHHPPLGRSPARRRLIPLLILASSFAARARALEFFASPLGLSTGNGSFGSPWDLKTALKQPAALKPGDVLWLRGGVYHGTFVSSLTGTASAPIRVQSYPGEHPRIDGGNSNGAAIFQIGGAYAWYWGFEIMSSSATRTTLTSGAEPGSTIPTGVGVTTLQTPGHDGLKLINMVIHDTRGNGFWKDATNLEVNGCLIYYNGWSGPDRGHGHAIYAQNATGTMHFTDNIIFQQFDKGIQFFGGSTAPINNMDVEGNTVFQNGNIDNTESNNIQIGGGLVAQNPVFKNNMTYYSGIGKEDIGGYNTAGTSNLVYQNNYDASNRDWPTVFTGLHGFAISGNTFRGYAGGLIPSAFPSNTFYFSSSGTVPLPVSPTAVFVRPNAYEPGRANITIYNWAKASTVDVNVGSVLKSGDVYELRNAQNFYGSPVLSGTYAGTALHVPMTGLVSAVPVGYPTPKQTAPEFNAFVLIKKSAATTTPPPPTGTIPDPHFSVQPASAPINTAVKFVDTSLNKPTSWVWNFGDSGSTSNTSTVQNPSHVFVAKGTHTVRLTVKNAAGQASTTNTVNIF